MLYQRRISYSVECDNYKGWQFGCVYDLCRRGACCFYLTTLWTAEIVQRRTTGQSVYK